MKANEKGQSVFTREIIEKGKIICAYNGELRSYSELQMRQPNIIYVVQAVIS